MLTVQPYKNMAVFFAFSSKMCNIYYMSENSVQEAPARKVIGRDRLGTVVNPASGTLREQRVGSVFGRPLKSGENVKTGAMSSVATDEEKDAA